METLGRQPLERNIDFLGQRPMIYRESAPIILSVGNGAPGHYPVNGLHVDFIRIVSNEVAKGLFNSFRLGLPLAWFLGGDYGRLPQKCS